MICVIYSLFCSSVAILLRNDVNLLQNDKNILTFNLFGSIIQLKKEQITQHKNRREV